MANPWDAGAAANKALYGRLAAARLEDLRWMAETGECLTGAARRLGTSVEALSRWLFRWDARDLYQQMADRDPIQPDAPDHMQKRWVS